MPEHPERIPVDPTALLVNLGLALAIAAASAAIAARLGQSVILGYLVAGLVIGPHTPGWEADPPTVEALANIGVVLLMFAIGMQLSVRELARVGPVAAGGGVTQVFVMIGAGYLAGIALGWSTLEALFLGAVVSNSSSTVIGKILSERGETGSVHGRVSLAWSSVQDLSTIVLVVVLSALAVDGDQLWREGALALLLATGFLIILLPVGSRVLPIVFERLLRQRNREVFILAAAAIAMVTAYVATVFGLSPALGAFVAGIVLSESDVRHEVLGGLSPIRDIFAGLFFVSLGMLISPSFVLSNIGPVLLTVMLIVVVKGVLSLGLTALFRYPARTAVLAGVALAQSAEFSFVMANVGIEVGAISEDVFSLMLSGAVASVLLAPALHRGALPVADWAERRFPQPAVPEDMSWDLSGGLRDHAIICGHGRAGSVIAQALRAQGLPMVLMDLDVDVVRRLRDDGIPALLGSAENSTLLDRVNLEEARLLVIALPDALATRRIVEHAREVNPDLPIVARTHSAAEREALHGLGVNEAVLAEFELAIEMARFALQQYGLSIMHIESELNRLRDER
jgi:monovalent cation:H+ antiporter-2, CPA2 family